MILRSYPSDCSDEKWAFVAPTSPASDTTPSSENIPSGTVRFVVITGVPLDFLPYRRHRLSAGLPMVPQRRF